MYNELQYRGAVATFRRRTEVSVRAGGRIVGAEERYRLTLDDMLYLVVVIGLINRQDEVDHAIATVRSPNGIAIDTGGGEGFALELIALAFADRYADGILYGLVHYELQGVEGTFAIDDRGVVTIGTGVVEGLLLAAPLIGPYIRQIVLTDRDDGINQRMYCKEEFSDGVTTLRRQCRMAIGARSGVRLTVEHITLTFVDIYRNMDVNRFVHRKQEGHDTIATIAGAEGIAVGSGLGVTNAIETIFRSFAHRVTNSIGDHRYHAHVANVDAVVQILGL